MEDARKRNLYLNNMSVDEALERYMAVLRPTLAGEKEHIAVIDALDRVTGGAVYALCNSPLYDSAAMDGVAVISARTRGASDSMPLTLKFSEDYCVVDTGDPIPPPYDAVIMAEDIQDHHGEVVIRAAAAPWQHVRPVGEDIVQGEMILPSRHKIRPVDVGVLLSAGITDVLVYKKLEVAVLPTGTELVEPGGAMKEGGIIESNSYMLSALVTQGGGVPCRFSPTPDDYERIKEIVEEAAGRFDVTLICAGTSAGTEDYTVHILRELGEVVVHGVAMKPGKPVILAVVKGKPVIGVPGYPVSASLAYDIFVAPVLAALSGNDTGGVNAHIKAVLSRPLVSSLKHREYVRVKVGHVGEKLVASPLSRDAGAAMSLVRADGFCVIEQDSEGKKAGEEVDVVLYRSPGELENTLVSIGSHDLILDVIADLMPNEFPGCHLSSTHVGSMGGLLALKGNEAHMAPTHLLDEKTGVYNIPALKELFNDRAMALIKGVGRTQGIMVKKGNPLGISGVADLTRCTYVNRQRGAGTRVLLDYYLKSAGIDTADITGYDREAATHMAVAAAIRDGAADAGMGVLSATRAMDLGFIPIGDEEYDFAIPAQYLELAPVRAFISILKSPLFLAKLEELGGYSAARCGEVLLV